MASSPSPRRSPGHLVAEIRQLAGQVFSDDSPRLRLSGWWLYSWFSLFRRLWSAQRDGELGSFVATTDLNGGMELCGKYLHQAEPQGAGLPPVEPRREGQHHCHARADTLGLPVARREVTRKPRRRSLPPKGVLQRVGRQFVENQPAPARLHLPRAAPVPGPVPAGRQTRRSRGHARGSPSRLCAYSANSTRAMSAETGQQLLMDQGHR